jgi:predicted nuclease with TOPRIM domain
MKIEIDYLHFHNLNRNVLDLGSKVRDLTEENKRLKYEAVHDAGQLGEQSAEIASLRAEVERLNSAVNYWRIESEVDNARWLRTLEEIETLRKGV